jgi:EAL domain-containing protein (putative c-di-GMP-specific phosphodiesterase class I)
VILGAAAGARATGLAEAIAAMMLQPFAAQGGSVVLHTSIGVAVHASGSDSEMDLLRKAELAMYSAKESGKARHHVYTPQLSQRADHLMKWEQQLRVALAEGQLFLAYQPKLDLERRCITGFEVLLRWNHPTLGQIPAKEFIPVAESTGLIVPIGNMVIESACRQLRTWHLAGYAFLTLSVNISSMQFWRGDLLATVERCLQKHDCEPRTLEFEITETAMMEFPDLVSEKIMALKRLGVRIALDDFGTGYSSLSYLNRFSVDTLKIDRSFVHAVPIDVEACVMVTAIVNLGRSLGLCIVVEGVETEAQASWLSALGPLQAQGFLFSPPVGIDAVPALLARFGVCGTAGAHAEERLPG